MNFDRNRTRQVIAQMVDQNDPYLPGQTLPKHYDSSQIDFSKPLPTRLFCNVIAHMAQAREELRTYCFNLLQRATTMVRPFGYLLLDTSITIHEPLDVQIFVYGCIAAILRGRPVMPNSQTLENLALAFQGKNTRSSYAAGGCLFKRAFNEELQYARNLRCVNSNRDPFLYVVTPEGPINRKPDFGSYQKGTLTQRMRTLGFDSRAALQAKSLRQTPSRLKLTAEWDHRFVIGLDIPHVDPGHRVNVTVMELSHRTTIAKQYFSYIRKHQPFMHYKLFLRDNFPSFIIDLKLPVLQSAGTPDVAPHFAMIKAPYGPVRCTAEFSATEASEWNWVDKNSTNLNSVHLLGESSA